MCCSYMRSHACLHPHGSVVTCMHCVGHAVYVADLDCYTAVVLVVEEDVFVFRDIYTQYYTCVHLIGLITYIE